MAAILIIAMMLAARASYASCALTASDWNEIKSAYLERNHYELLKADTCNETLVGTSLQSRYGECSTPLGTVLVESGLEEDCFGHFNSTLYNGAGAKTAELAHKLCSEQTLAESIKDNICNPLSVVGCPTTRDIVKFTIYAYCYGVQLQDKTPEEQRAYFDSGSDVECMKNSKVCQQYMNQNWHTCPVYIHEVFYFIDSSHVTYTCDLIYPSAPERCEERFTDSFYRYCPLPTELEKNMPFIVVFSIAGPCLLAALVYVLWRHTRQTKSHHISVREVMTNAVNNLEVFNHPMHHAHPELQTVLATSKFKGVLFDKKTQMWSVIGESMEYATEKEAAQRAYLIMAKLTSNAGGSPRIPAKRATIVDEEMRPQNSEEAQCYVVTSKPLTPEQTMKMRLQQLIAFYEFWEPEKPDILEHARNLLEKHEFEAVVRALKTKYGVCPPSWDTFGEV